MIHTRIKDRTAWLKELWEYVQTQFDDLDAARTAYKRLCFEEK
jgi:hypothetical protein